MEEFYCVKCKQKVQAEPTGKKKSKNGRPILVSECPECGTKLNKFVSAKKEK